MATELELRQSINEAQRRAHYLRGRRDGMQLALRLMEELRATPEGRGIYAQLSTSLQAASKEAARASTELDDAYAAYNRRLKRA